MHFIWHWLLWLLTLASSEPSSIDAEKARAAGCVNVVYASFAVKADE